MRSITAATIMSAFAPLLTAGCMARVGYTAPVSNEGYAPEMAEAAPGVQVIVDYDEPIFYADSFYWRFSGGGWYRSPHHNGGWVYATPPPAIRRIDRPQAYVHYRPAGWAGRRERGPQQPVARGQPVRGEPPPRQPAYQPPPPRAAQVRGEPPRAAQPGPRDRGRHDDHDQRDHRGDGDHHDHRGGEDHHDHH